MLATILQVTGVALVSIGLGIWFLPLGVIAAGLSAVAIGISLERS